MVDDRARVYSNVVVAKQIVLTIHAEQLNMSSSLCLYFLSPQKSR